MIDFDNPPTRVSDYRGTIEVHTVDLGDFDSAMDWVPALEWYWRCKAKNGQILASGEGYRRRAGALNAINAQYALALATTRGLTDDVLDSSGSIAQYLVIPWRVVIHDRDGNIDKIGALY